MGRAGSIARACIGLYCNNHIARITGVLDRMEIAEAIAEAVLSEKPVIQAMRAKARLVFSTRQYHFAMAQYFLIC